MKFFNFLANALSEVTGQPSMKRFTAFIIVGCIVSIHVYYEVTGQPGNLLTCYKWDVGFAAVLLGVATVAQLLSIWKGTPTEPTETEKPH